MFNCSNVQMMMLRHLAPKKYITMLNNFKFLLSMLIFVNSDIRLVSFRLFSSSFSMLFFGVLQHRQYIQNLSEGQVYIFLHFSRIALTPSCSTPLTLLKFKSETLLYSPNHNLLPSHLHQPLITSPFGIKFRYTSTPTSLNSP